MTQTAAEGIVSQAEFARRRGVSWATVTHWKNAGRLPPYQRGQGRRRRLRGAARAAGGEDQGQANRRAAHVILAAASIIAGYLIAFISSPYERPSEIELVR